MRRLALSACLAVGLCAAAAPLAEAQRGYVANSGSASVSFFETGSSSAQGAIAAGNAPAEIAVLPNGSRAYVTNRGDDTVSVVDTAANAVITTIPVGDEPTGIAITPDGSRAYVANTKANSVSVISTVANGVLGPAISVGSEPEGVAVTPEGIRVLVAQRGGDIAVIETSTGSVIGSIADSLGPTRLALTPDGKRGFATNASSNSVTIFSLVTGAVLGVPLLVGANPSGMALSPNGPAYAASASDNTVVAIDPVNHARIGPPIPGFAGPSGIASTADGSLAYVANSAASSVSVIDAATASVKTQIPVGLAPQGIAIVPDQPPHAFFTSERAEKRGQSFRFDASSSTDSDGQVGIYSWDFGDGQTESGPSAQVEHIYANPGGYRVTLTVVDNQGCSISFVFTGQTASCNGSGVARSSSSVTALDTIPPAFRLTASPRQRLRPTVVLVASCPKESCRVSITGALDTVVRAKTPKEHRLRGHHPTARSRVSIPSGGKAKLRLRLTRPALKAARRSLRQDGRATLKIKGVARDAAGNKATRKAGITLIAPSPRGASSRDSPGLGFKESKLPGGVE